MIERDKWKWFGTSGHFICGQWCRFHMLTEIGKYVVSSVGMYVHPMHSNGCEKDDAEWLLDNWPGADIGSGRKFETYVFETTGHCEVMDCSCGQPLHNGNEVEGHGCNDIGQANANHMTMCLKYAELQGADDANKVE